MEGEGAISDTKIVAFENVTLVILVISTSLIKVLKELRSFNVFVLILILDVGFDP